MQILYIVPENVLFRKGLWHTIDTLLKCRSVYILRYRGTFDIVSTGLRLSEGSKDIITFNGPGHILGVRKISLISET